MTTGAFLSRRMSHRDPCAMLFALSILAVTASTAFAQSWGQPPNVGDVKFQAIAYRSSGAYDRDLAAVAGRAEDYVRFRAGRVSRPALVLDIDETSLSNWPEIRANDFGYIAEGPCHLPKGPCAVRAWELSARGTAIAPTLKLFKTARSLQVSVFFITGRHADERRATELNLRRAGYAGWTGLIMRPVGSTGPAADFKAPERAKIEGLGFTIIANMGDQPSDLAGGHAERSYLLPNPFYRIP